MPLLPSVPPTPAGPLPSPHRIFLSQATLVVVTPPLVQHWRRQMQLHVRPREGGVPGLPALAYTSEDREEAKRKGRPLTPQRLAWEAAVVSGRRCWGLPGPLLLGAGCPAGWSTPHAVFGTQALPNPRA